MEIVRAFNNNNLHTEIIIKGTYEEPLFRASDIAEILEISNIRTSIQDYNETEKVYLQTNTVKGNQKTCFLTEKGLYKLLFRSNKPIANEFQNWACDVIKEIRLNGTYQLQKELKEKNEKLKEQEEEILQQNTKINDIEEQNKYLMNEVEQVKIIDKKPVIYAFNIDTRNPKPELKIGSSQNYYDRIKPYRQTNKFGKIEFVIEVNNNNLKKFEEYVHYVLNSYRIEGEVFRIDVLEAKMIILDMLRLHEKINISDQSERLLKISQIHDYSVNIMNNVKSPAISTNTISTQTNDTDFKDIMDIEEINSTIIKDKEKFNNFDLFVCECCIVREDVEDSTINLSGQYRIWNKDASKEDYLNLLEYLKIKFKPCRLKKQDKNNVVNGFHGIKLKEIEYKKSIIPCDVETFIFHKCIFSPCGKILVEDLKKEYILWKTTLNKTVSLNEEKEIKKYLNECEYVLKSTVWTHNGNGLGYYGISFKTEEIFHKVTATTGKNVEKRSSKTDEVIDKFETIAKAAEAEKISPAKMSRSIKNKVIFNEDYYYVCP